MTETSDNEIIQNSIKNLVFINLLRIFNNQIIFCGSLCDIFYIDLPISKITDIDILVDYKNKDVVLNTILFEPFYIKQNSRRRKIQLYKTYEPITNFRRAYTAYGSYSCFGFKYRYSMSILGINVDIFFYTSDYIKYGASHLFYKPTSGQLNQFVYNINNINILSKKERMHNLSYSIASGFGREKHIDKLKMYRSHDDSIGNKTLFKLNDLDIFKLPANFSAKKYLNKNKDITDKIFCSDAAISHYLSHGIKENRKYE